MSKRGSRGGPFGLMNRMASKSSVFCWEKVCDIVFFPFHVFPSLGGETGRLPTDWVWTIIRVVIAFFVMLPLTLPLLLLHGVLKAIARATA